MSGAGLGGQLGFEREFPDPAKQAEALLETCQGNIGEAQGIALTNLKFANYPVDRLYWMRVEALISNQEPAVVMERLLTCKLDAGQPASEGRPHRITSILP
jgi:hypothetical protein